MNNKMRKMKSGFTLIELLVVVIIIGLLAAIALPQYRKAVVRSKFHALMPIAKSLANSNEAYYLEYNNYTEDPAELPVQGKQDPYPDGTTVELFNDPSTLSFVRAGNSSIPNIRYVVTQKHSATSPDSSWCEANDDAGKELCKSFMGGNSAEAEGSSGTESGWTAYLLSGEGDGSSLAGGGNGGNSNSAYLASLLSCAGADTLGYDCNVTTNEEGKKVKSVCVMDWGEYSKLCRTKTFNEDGSYRSVTCYEESFEDGVCKDNYGWVNYDSEGRQVSLYDYGNYGSGHGQVLIDYPNGKSYVQECGGYPSALNEAGTACSGEVTGFGTEVIYENGKLMSEIYCDSIQSDGTCASYNQWGGWRNDYVYDGDQLLGVERCYQTNNSGECTGSATSSEYYTYENGVLSYGDDFYDIFDGDGKKIWHGDGEWVIE